MGAASTEDYVLYDGECPVCSRYVAFTNLRTAAPQIAVIDARDRPDLVSLYRAKGIEINEGMIIKVGDLVLDGSAAFAMINQLSKPNSRAATFALKLLSGKTTSALLYPVLALGRRGLLRLLRRELI